MAGFTRRPRGCRGELWWRGQTLAAKVLAEELIDSAVWKAVTVQDSGQSVALEPGDSLFSLDELVGRVGATKDQIRDALKALESVGFLSRHRARSGHAKTQYRVTDWGSRFGQGSTSPERAKTEPTKSPQRAHKGNTDEQGDFSIVEKDEAHTTAHKEPTKTIAIIAPERTELQSYRAEEEQAERARDAGTHASAREVDGATERSGAEPSEAEWGHGLPSDPALNSRVEAAWKSLTRCGFGNYLPMVSAAFLDAWCSPPQGENRLPIVGAAGRNGHTPSAESIALLIMPFLDEAIPLDVLAETAPESWERMEAGSEWAKDLVAGLYFRPLLTGKVAAKQAGKKPFVLSLQYFVTGIKGDRLAAFRKLENGNFDPPAWKLFGLQIPPGRGVQV